MAPTTTSTQPLTRRGYGALSLVAARGSTLFVLPGECLTLIDRGYIAVLGSGRYSAELTAAGRAELAAGPPADDSYSLNVKVGAAEVACRALLARTDLPLQARTIVEHLAQALNIDDPHEDGAPTGGERA